MDFLRNGGQSGLYRLFYPQCVSRRIDTWQIVYLSYNDPCPTRYKNLYLPSSCRTGTLAHGS